MDSDMANLVTADIRTDRANAHISIETHEGEDNKENRPFKSGSFKNWVAGCSSHAFKMFMASFSAFIYTMSSSNKVESFVVTFFVFLVVLQGLNDARREGRSFSRPCCRNSRTGSSRWRRARALYRVDSLPQPAFLIHGNGLPRPLLRDHVEIGRLGCGGHERYVDERDKERAVRPFPSFGARRAEA